MVLAEQHCITGIKKYGGMEASEMKKVKELEAENTRLKRMYANLAMELDVAKYIIEKKKL